MHCGMSKGWRTGKGRDKTVIIHHILAKDTMDERVMKVLSAKDGTQADLLDALKAKIKEKQK